MPRNYYCPKYAIIAGFDTSQYNGEYLFSRNTTQVSGLEYPDEVAQDAVMYLNGHGSFKSLEEELNAAVQASAHPDKANITFTISINAQDKVLITCNKYDFELQETGAYIEEVLGFPSGGGGWMSSPGTPFSVNTVEAPDDWVRGDFTTSDLELEFDTTGTPTTVSFGNSGRVQDVPILLRSSGALASGTGVGDLDDESDNKSLQSADNTYVGTTQIRWGINAYGRVFVSYRKALNDISAWDDTDFRDRLGFTGGEAVSSLGSLFEMLTATNPLPGALFPSRPLDRIDIETPQVGGFIRLTDSRVASNLDAIHHRWQGMGYLDGPADVGGTVEDLHLHYHYRVMPYIYIGYKCSLYQDWGDSRRASDEVANDYGILYTNEMNHYRGRIAGRVATNNSTTQKTVWPQDLRRRSPLTFWILEEHSDY